jgi:hypothetical protein
MKRIAFAVGALGLLTATPAVAGLVDEVAQGRNEAVQLVSTPRSERWFLGQYQTYGSRVAQGELPEGQVVTDGQTDFVAYPEADRPSERGR